MSKDMRVRYTKMIIKSSFVALLKKQPVNRITVKKLCDLAEINRSTFYKHYLDIYDLMEKIEEEFTDNLKKILLSEKNKSPKEILTLIMKNLKDNDDYYVLFSENGDPDFPKKLFEICYSIDEVHKNFCENIPENKRKFYYQFIAQGCGGILNQWITGGMKEPIEETAEFAENLIKKLR